MQCFIVDSIDFHAFMPKNNLPLATFLAPIHLPILAHTSASGWHVWRGRGASLNCLHSRTTGSIDELLWATWCRVVNLHNVSLFQKMQHYAMLVLQSWHERHTCETFMLWHVVQTFAWTFDLYPKSATNKKTYQACTWPWSNVNQAIIHVIMAQTNMIPFLQTFWHGETNEMMIDHVAIVSSACMNMIFKPNYQQVSIPWHVFHVPWQPNSAEVKASLHTFFFPAGNILWGLCFVHIAWTIHACFFIYGLLWPSSCTPASIM